MSSVRTVTSLFLVVAMATLGKGENMMVTCGEPDLHELRMNLPHAQPEGSDFDASFLNLPHVPERLKLWERYGHFWTGPKRTAYVSGPRDCKTQQPGPPLCPTYYVIDFDPNRVPHVLFHARCTCRKCRHYLHGFCQPVLTYRHVLRRVGCTDGVYVYRPVWEPVPVDCKCEARVSEYDVSDLHTAIRLPRSIRNRP